MTQLRAGDTAAAERTFERLLAEDRKSREHPPSFARGANPLASASSRFSGRLTGTVAGAAGATPALSPVMRDWLRTLLDAVALPADDRADANCAVLLKGRCRLPAFTTSAEVLAKAGHWPAVAAVARAGLVQFPGSTQLTRWGETAAGKVAALPPPAVAGPILPAVPHAAKPSEPSPRVAAAPLAPNNPTMAQADFFAKLDDAVHRGAWAEAADLIREVKAATPPWLPRVEADLAWREVRFAFEQDDRPQLLYLISQRIRIRKTEVGRALEFARWYRDKHEIETARTIVGRILQEVPGHVAAQNLLAELARLPGPNAAPNPPPKLK